MSSGSNMYNQYHRKYAPGMDTVVSSINETSIGSTTLREQYYSKATLSVPPKKGPNYMKNCKLNFRLLPTTYKSRLLYFLF